MAVIKETVGTSAGTVTLHAHPNATMAELIVRAAEGHEVTLPAGHGSLLEVTAACAAIAGGHETDQQNLSIFSGIAGYGTSVDGLLSLQLVGSGSVTVVAVDPASSQSAGAILTLEEVAQLAQHCAAAAHNR